MLQIRLHLPDPTLSTLTSAGTLECTCGATLTGRDSHHLHICGSRGTVTIHNKVNDVFLSAARWARCSVLGDRAFRECGIPPCKKLPDGAIYGLQHDGGPLVIDTRVVSPLAATNLDSAMT